MKQRSGQHIRNLVYIALMAVLICLCSWLTVPFTVPFTMQTFAVFCALLLLGGVRGTAAILLYLLMGVVGLPVFSGFRGGIGHLLGPTGGYVIGFVLSGIVYLLSEPLIRRNERCKWLALGIGLAVCYAAGTLWFTGVYRQRQVDYGLFSVLTLCVFPYIIPDCAKMALAVFLCKRIKKHIRF